MKTSHYRFMNRDRAFIIIIYAAAIAGLLLRDDTIEGFGFGLLIGLILGAIVGAAFVFDREKAV